MTNKLFIAGVVLLFLLGMGWLVYYLSIPLPGVKMPELGRDHITDIAEITYNSNPPTSGSHFPLWAKPGLYPEVISDGYLIHSLEHGYVVISYNCDKKFAIFNFQLVKNVFAHDDDPLTEASDSGKLLMHMTAVMKGDESWITPNNLPPTEIELPSEFASDSCKKLVEELRPFLNVKPRVIIVPRPSLDARIAMTAWNRVETMDAVDSEKITTFIKAHHNNGPEQTME